MDLKSLRANDMTMTYLEAGSIGAPPVLLVHGLGWDAERLWSGVAEHLAANGLRVLAPNLRGVGGTEASDVAYTTALYAEDLDAFLDVLGIAGLPVVGFSMGASIATALYDRSDRVSALCLACGGLHATDAGQAGVEAMLARAEIQGPQAFAAEQADAIFHPAWSAAHPEAVADFKSWRAKMDQSALKRAFRSGYGTDYRDVFRAATVPLSVIAAETDPFCSLADLQTLAASNPRAQFQVIAQSGHMAMIEQPAAFHAALLAFLAPLAAAA